MAEDLLQVEGMLASAIGDLAAAKGLVAFISVGLSWLQGLAMASYTPGEMGTQGMAVSAIIFSTLLTQLMSVMGVGIGFIVRNGPGALAIGIV